MKSHNRLASVVGNIKEIKEMNLLFKVTNSFQKTMIDDTNIMLQKCLQIMTIDQEKRSLMQSKYIQKYFEKEFPYFLKLRGQLPDDLFLKIFKDLQLEKMNQLEIVFNIGDIGRKMYFIIEGEVGILIPMQEQNHQENHHHQFKNKIIVRKFDDLLKHKFQQYKLIAVKTKSDHFGEIAIEQRVPRTASVVTKTDCVFATLSYESYQKVLGQLQEKIMEEKLNFISITPPFKNWSQNGQLILLHSCQEITFEAGSFIYKRGQKGDSVYIIKEGEILVEKWTKQQSIIQEGDIYLKKNTIVIGLYSTGQIFGDYEVYQTNMKCKFITRITQAKARVKTVVLALSIQQYIDNMRLNERDAWIKDYYEQKFSKKWLIKPENNIQEFNKSPLPSNNNKQYIKSREEGRSRYKVSISNNNFDEYENDNRKDSKDLMLLSPNQLQNQSKSNKSMRKFLFLQGNLFKTQQQQESSSMDPIIKYLKNKVIKNRDNLTNETNMEISQTKFYSLKKTPSAPKLKIGLSFKSFRDVDRNKSKFLD